MTSYGIITELRVTERVSLRWFMGGT